MNAGWPVTDTLTVDPTWVSGYYLIRVLLLDGPQPGASATTYWSSTRRSPTRACSSRCPVNTWQAYNPWGGKSTYDLPGLGRRANHVSFDRPFDWAGPGGQGPLGWEIPFVRFVERNGYDVELPVRRLHGRASRVAVAAPPGRGRGPCRVLDEDDARRVRSGARRAVSTSRSWARTTRTGRCVSRTPAGRSSPTSRCTTRTRSSSEKTAMFREIGRLECGLIGIQHQGASPLYWKAGDYTVRAGALADPWMRNTGFLAGERRPRASSASSRTRSPATRRQRRRAGIALTVFFHRENGGDKDGNADATRYTRSVRRDGVRERLAPVRMGARRLLRHARPDAPVRRPAPAAVHAERARRDDEVSARSCAASSLVRSPAA